MSEQKLPRWLFNKNPPNNIHICVKTSENIIAELKKHKGDQSWASLLIDGLRYREKRVLAPAAIDLIFSIYFKI